MAEIEGRCMTDYHLHTMYSHDSVADMEEYVVTAIEKGMTAICFTEHLDFNQCSPGTGNYFPDKFFRQFYEVKKRYGDKLDICAGVEAGEPHVYGKELAEFLRFPYDFILGSVHWVGDTYLGKTLAERYSVEEFFDIYWREILKAVKQGGFDALAHIDLPARAFRKLWYTEPVMKEIFRYLVDKDMVLEINTSSIRKGVGGALLDGELLEIYKDCGGQYVTIGSDAHRVQDMGTGYLQARELAQKCGLQEVTFKERKKYPIF